jgi:hypothetical protein
VHFCLKTSLAAAHLSLKSSLADAHVSFTLALADAKPRDMLCPVATSEFLNLSPVEVTVSFRRSLIFLTFPTMDRCTIAGFGG